MSELLLPLIQELLYVSITVGVGFLIAYMKKKLSVEQLKQIKTEMDNKREIIELVVLFVQQVYSHLDGNARYEEALNRASILLQQKGLKITDEELQSLLESSVKNLKYEFGESWKEL